MKNRSVSTEDLVHYLEQLQKDPAEKERFNRSIRKEAEKERKRKGGQFTAMFLDAIRIP